MHEFNKDNIRLIALDLDDTIIMHGTDVSPLTLSAIQHVHSQGITVAISTGRLVRQIPAVLRNSPCIRYIIGANGGCIIDKETQEILSHSYLDKKQVKEIVQTGKRTNAGIYLNCEGVGYCDLKCLFMTIWFIRRKYSRAQRKEVSQLYRFRLLPLFGLKRFLSKLDDPVYKVSCMYRREEIRAAQSDKYKDIKGISYAFVSGHGLEITADDATKGIAIGFLCDKMGISKQEVVAFGDSGNDMSMREYAGTFVAMGNASSEVKEIADFITGKVAEDGVAMFLNEHWLGTI